MCVGEDGPTHQPVETFSSLRLMPNLDVIRPADNEETVGAYVASVERKTGPTAIILSRQGVKTIGTISADERRFGTLKGAYVIKKEKSELKMILIGSGSEVQLCMVAADALGDGVRVVSMPCMERFERQDRAYQESVLPSRCTKRLAIEAGVSHLWHKYVGNGKIIGIDKFGLSAPGRFSTKRIRNNG